MDEPDWAKILRYLHNNNGEIQSVAEFEEDSEEEPSNEDHEEELYRDLTDKIDLENPEREGIVETHKHLQNTGLAEFEQRRDYAALKLTPDGFDVAHERELSKRDDRINQSLVFFTFILVLAQILGVVPVGDLSKVIISLVILGGMLTVIWKSDVLE